MNWFKDNAISLVTAAVTITAAVVTIKVTVSFLQEDIVALKQECSAKVDKEAYVEFKKDICRAPAERK